VQPSEYTRAAYDAGREAVDAVRRVAASGRPTDRHNVRDAVQATRPQTLRGLIHSDADRDVPTETVRVFQIVRDPVFPLDDVPPQYKYHGFAPRI
jgi:hypothetical protein